MYQFKDIFWNAKTFVGIAVVIAAGWYLYSNKIFPFQDVGQTRAEINHDIYSACLNSKHRWLRTIVDVRNIGDVGFKLSENDHYVSHVAPAEKYAFPDPATTGFIDWPMLSHSPPSSKGEGLKPNVELKPHETHSQTTDFSIHPSDNVVLEPNETHRQYQDFVIPPAVKVVEVTSAFRNPSRSKNKKIVNWEAKTIYDVGDPSCP